MREFERFFGCPVEFGAPNTALQISADALHLPLISADPKLLRVLRPYCDAAAKKRNVKPGTLRSAVEAEVEKLLPDGKAKAENVAEALALSLRTLARRLAYEGTTYGSKATLRGLQAADDMLSHARLSGETAARGPDASGWGALGRKNAAAYVRDRRRVRAECEGLDAMGHRAGAPKKRPGGHLQNQREQITPPGTAVRIPRQSGRGFRFDVGHRSDLIPATIPK